jgi:lipopolysaccharide/colanic/teichoic acid biosynthesis glycosyltransferase
MATSIRLLRLPPAIRERVEHGRSREGARRFLNLVVALVGIILTSVIMFVIALLIKCSSRGPVIFSQTRIGRDRRSLTYARGNSRRKLDLGGQPFTLYKFRTMHADTGNGRQVWALPDDQRITPLGRVLRGFRLDELPQLFSVLTGEMNIVGPRPEQPQIFVELRELVEGYQRRQRVRPGITGLAQITLGYDRSIDDVRKKVHCDLDYIRRQSLMEDLKIMLLTVPVMFSRRGW